MAVGLAVLSYGLIALKPLLAKIGVGFVGLVIVMSGAF